MRLKNVKIGTRVQLKKDNPCEPSLKKGMKGTIIEDNSINPYISWDNFKKGHDGYYCNQTLIDLGLPDYSVWWVEIKYLKRIKG